MDHNKPDDREIERLLREAGQRQDPPNEMRERVYAVALQAWQDLPEQGVSEETKRPFGRGALALAAAALVAVTLGIFMNTVDAPGVQPMAEVVYVRGEYQLDGTAMLGQALMQTPSEIQTGPGSLVSMRLASGALVTLGEDTAARVINSTELKLSAGRIYVDVEKEVDERQANGPSLAVLTKHARIVDIGTQFEVRVNAAADEQKLRVLIRSGRVDVVGTHHTYTATAHTGMGEELLLRGDTLLERNPVATTDSRWHWRKAGRAPYLLNESTVFDYLSWLAADTGHELRFTSRAVEQMARIGVLRSQAGLTSDETDVEDILAATRFAVRQPREGLWVVQFRSAG